MIVQQHKQGWKIISHYTHGLVAGKFAEQLKPGLRPEQWIDTLTAIIEHDDHLLDYAKGDYLTDNGSPMDFKMAENNNKEALEHAQRVYSNCVQKSQMVGLLVGRHLNFLYEGLAKEYGPMQKFLSEIRDKAKKQRKLYGLDKKNEKSIYNLMRFCDRCSLILCQDTVPETGRKLEINETIDSLRYHIYRNGPSKLVIEPWPFEKNSFTIDLEYRIIDKPAFKNSQELKKEIQNAKVHLELFPLHKS